MTTTYPGAVDSYTTKVDNVTQVVAANINDVQDAIVAIETDLISKAPNDNLLYHTITHDLWLTGSTFNDVTDDSYVATLWNAMHNGQNPDISGVTTEDNTAKALKCLFDSAASQAGFAQFLPNGDTLILRGKTVSFSIYVTVNNISNMRASILSWTGTADTITSDVVGTWGTGNPTLAANWAYLDTPADQATSGTTRLLVEGIEIPNTANNLAVFVWTPAQEASTDFFTLSRAKLEFGLTATDFVSPIFKEEKSRIGQIYSKSYDDGTSPGTSTEVGGTFWQTRRAIAGSTSGFLFPGPIQYLSPMFRVPTFTLYSTTGASGAVRNATAANDRTGATASSISSSSVSYIAISNASANAIALDDTMGFQFTADARL